MTVYLLVDGLYYPGAFSSRELAVAARERWRAYVGRTAQIAALTMDELALDKYDMAGEPPRTIRREKLEK